MDRHRRYVQIETPKQGLRSFRFSLTARQPDPIPPSPQELDHILIPQELELLSDLRPHIIIGRMLRLQMSLKSIDVLQQKFLLFDSFHAQQNVQQPAFGFDITR